MTISIDTHDTDTRYTLASFEGQQITILSYEESEGEYGPFLILTVQVDDIPNEPVTVATGASIIVERVKAWFHEHPGAPMVTIPQQKLSKRGRLYWTLPNVSMSATAEPLPFVNPA